MHGRIMTRSTARRWPGKILFYERVREEWRKGKPFMVALQDCYRASTCTILDANALILAVRT
jgi:preprotein translocase subunit SecD